MKVAGSSWKVLRAVPKVPPSPFVIIVLLTIISISAPCASFLQDSGGCDGTDYTSTDTNLIGELADASSKETELKSDIKDLLEPYDATPFWYNLVHAITLASGINPTTKHVLHELVTSSFYSSGLNDSIKKVISFMKCSVNRTLEETKPPLEDIDSIAHVLLESNFMLPDTDYTVDGNDGGGESGASDQKENDSATEHNNPADHAPPQRAYDWNPWEQLLLRNWNPENENSENSILGPLLVGRNRRELRDGGRNVPHMADFHQPFFMSEVGPSSLVTRHPSIISVSGCPSGHVQDLRGVCRQIFQYTVNYGGGNTRTDNNFVIPPGIFGSTGGSSRRPPWLLGRPPSRIPPTGTLREIARDSALFKHSVMRGYVPPFIFPSRVPQDGGVLKDSHHNSKQPESVPMEIMAPMPQIVIMEAPTVPDITPTVPALDTHQGTDTKGSATKEEGAQHRDGGGHKKGSSENTDSSSYSTHENNKKSSKKSKDSPKYSVRPKDDDD